MTRTKALQRKIKRPNHLLVEVLKPMGDYLKGQKVKVACDVYGVPVETYWRNRLKDALKDECCKVLETNVN